MKNTNTESDLYRHYLVDVSEVVGCKVLFFVLPDFMFASGHGESYCPYAILMVHSVECL